ncbi:MAG TPA: hypothetical protein VFN89_11695 [Solirubrobacterales bacterium]|nr:hypothetical protein [Solirubrobacterales bacterium]
MSKEGDRIDEQVRLAVEALPDLPVRWDRIERRAHRREWMGLVALVLIGLALTLVLATGLLAGKSALDPSFSPPLLSHGGASASFDEPAFGHGLTPLSKFRATIAQAAGRAEAHEKKELGYVFNVSLDGVDMSPGFSPRWRIRHRGNGQSLPLERFSHLEIAHYGGDTSEAFTAWIEQPPRSGQYVVDFSLVSPDGIVVEDTSAPLHVVTRGLLHRYSTATYSAGVPRGWHVDYNYRPEPGHRFVTRLEGPHGMSVLIDTTPNVSGDPADSASTLEGLFENGGERYKRLTFARRNFDGPAFEWSFELGEHVSTDIFFYRGGDGYAVLAESPADRFREARLIARDVARSLRGA